MQFHLNGFHPGDPRVQPAALTTRSEVRGSLEEVDVLIVGCGPAGLVLATQLAAFPDIVTKIVDQKPGPLAVGQADGIACRSVEMFEAFGIAQPLLEESYWVNETTFWRPDVQDRTRIVRSGRVQDVEDGLSEFPHIIVNQARVHDLLLGVMRNSPTRLAPDYGLRVTGLELHDPEAGPITVFMEGSDGEQIAVRARYVVGCDGARSAVRQSLGIEMAGERADHAWGVMDVLATTDFPDIRLKSAIQSANGGNILLIPREGGYLVRIYVELGGMEGRGASTQAITSDDLIEATRRVLHPYSFDVHEIAWWSVYEVGQRLSDRFDDLQPGASGLPRVFIAGDACHTHSAKAGQGMNVSMQDGFNLAWKLAAVIRGQSAPTLLGTYSSERQAVAKELIDFDRVWARMLSAPPKESEDSDGEGATPAELQAAFVAQGRYTAGTATHYAVSQIRAAANHQDLAPGFPIGMRFHSAPVRRVSDARRTELGHAARADGRWRIYAFADNADPSSSDSRLRALCDFLAGAPESPVRRVTKPGADIDSVIDFRAVLQQSHRAVAIEQVPDLLLPRKGIYGLVDYEKVFCAEPSENIFELRDLERANGCMVVVRPDQYVAAVLPLDGFQELEEFFANVLLDAVGDAGASATSNAPLSSLRG